MICTGLGWAEAAQQDPAYSLNIQNTRSHKSRFVGRRVDNPGGLHCRPHICNLWVTASGWTASVHVSMLPLHHWAVHQSSSSLHGWLCCSLRHHPDLSHKQSSCYPLSPPALPKYKTVWAHLNQLKQRGQTVNEKSRKPVDSVRAHQTPLVFVCRCHLSPSSSSH